jgi:hypothetical protein
MKRVDQNISQRDAALQYAEKGWPVFPCTLDKLPCIEGGFLGSTCDAAQIRRWWTRWPDASIGSATGAVSGQVGMTIKGKTIAHLGNGAIVLDVDPRHAGDITLQDLEAEHGRLPDTVEVVTGGGGRHLYFAHPGMEIRNDVGKILGPGLDIRGDGGYVILPPSPHPSGQRYEWEASSDPEARTLAPMPSWLLGLLVAKANGRSASGNGRTSAPNDLSTKIRQSHRNDTLFRAGCALRRQGLPMPVIDLLLHTLNQEQCEPPLGHEEVQTIALSACRYDPTFSDPTIDDGERRAKALEWLQKYEDFASIQLASVRKLGDRYDFVLDGGRVVKLGDAAAVLTPRLVQAAIAHVTSKAIVELPRKDWRPVAERILEAAGEGEDLASEETDVIREWLNQWATPSVTEARHETSLEDSKAVADRLRKIKAGTANPHRGTGFFWGSDTRLYLHLPQFKDFLGTFAKVDMMSSKKIHAALRDIGIKPYTLEAWDGTSNVQMRLWRSEPGFALDAS